MEHIWRAKKDKRKKFSWSLAFILCTFIWIKTCSFKNKIIGFKRWYLISSVNFHFILCLYHYYLNTKCLWKKLLWIEEVSNNFLLKGKKNDFKTIIVRLNVRYHYILTLKLSTLDDFVIWIKLSSCISFLFCCWLCFVRQKL